MSVTDRDRKILIAIVPLAILLGYWFLLLAPKREEAAVAGKELAKEEQRLESAKGVDGALDSAKTDFAADYSELVRLGKAVPTKVDMPTLIVQLESAASGTGIRFSRIATGQRAAAGGAAGAAPPAPGSGDGSQPAAAGGATAKSGPGKATENAGNAVHSTNDKSAATESSVGPADAQTSVSTGKGVPVGGGSRASAAGPSGESQPGAAPGLDTVPLELEFQGSFFDLADFFHRLKRFVRLSDGQVDVRGRLMSIDGLKFSSDPEIFPRLKAELKATVYLAPKAQGETAGATPQGPRPDGSKATPASGGSSTPIAPTATAIP